MSTCKDCLHYDVCKLKHRKYFAEETDVEYLCNQFKPKADYVEVKHGEWIHCETDENDMEVFKCSVCNTKRYGTQNYCGVCGANMKGGAE